MSATLRFENRIAYLQLNRPEALNALSFAVLRDIGAHIRAVRASDARGLVITGAGEKAFCAGADIKELCDRSLLDEHEGARLGQQTFEQIAQLRIPSVAVLHGYAFGGGLELALACAFRIGTAKAKLALPEIKLGLVPGYGGTQRLPRLIGVARALDIILSGRTVLADEAERIGLIDCLVADPDPASGPEALGAAFLAPYLGYSLRTLDFARQAVVRGAQVTLEEGLRIECDLSTLAFRTQDAAEGMRAFIEKRPAVFKDE